MKRSSYGLLAAFVLAGFLLTLTGCEQAPAPVSSAPAATPAPAPQVVVEESQRRDDGKARRQQDDAADHPRPDDARKPDHP